MEGFLGGWLGTLGMVFTLLFFALPAITAVAIVLLVINYNAKKKAWEHDERMKALELGRPLPMPIVPVRKPKPYYPFAWPLVLLGIGLAICIGGLVDGETGVIVIGLALLLSGGGLLASRFIGVRNGKDEPEKPVEDDYYTIPPVDQKLYRDDEPVEEAVVENDVPTDDVSRFAPKAVPGEDSDETEKNE